MRSKRIQWLDFAKGFLIFIVLIYHAILTSGKISLVNLNNNHDVVITLLSFFMMPGFFAISGFLYKPTNTIHKYCLMLYKKFISIMIPGVLFTIIGISLQNYHILPDILHKWYELFLCQYGDTWFLTTLFFIFLIVGLMDLCHLSLYLEIIFSFILFFISKHFLFLTQNIFIVKHIIGGTPIFNIGTNIIFFYLGYILKKLDRNNIKSYIYKYNIQIIFLLIALLVMFLFININMPRVIISSFCILLLFIICMSIPTNNYLFKFFTKYGRFTLIIYLIHWPIIYFIIPRLLIYSHFVNDLTNNTVFLIFIKIIVSWIASIIVCQMAYYFSFINFIFYPRKYITKYLVATKLGGTFLNIK